jgi:hypothetical protein
VITYMSQLLTLVAAIVGVLLSPRKKGPGGRDALTPWAWLFIGLPIIGFGVSAWSTYQDQARAAAAQKKADQQASESRAAADAAQQKLDELRERMRDSIERIDILEVDVRFSISGHEIGWSPAAIEQMHSFFDIYSAIHTDHGRQLYGLDSEMFNGWRDVIDSERALYGEIQNALRPMEGASGGYLFLRHLAQDDFRAIIKKAFVPDIWTAHIDLTRLPPDVTVYPIDSPGLSRPIPAMPTVAAAEAWAIPDKNSDSPDVHVIWVDRLANRRNASLNDVPDFKDVQVAVYLPKPNPNLEGAPSLGAYGAPFGDLQAVDFDAGGMHWGWNSSMKTALDVMKFRENISPNESRESDLGFLAELQLGQRGALPGPW